MNSSGEPRVAPVDSVFFHGRFYISTGMRSFRVRRLPLRLVLSLTYFEGADPVILVHGGAIFVEKNHPNFGALASEWGEYGEIMPEPSKSVVFIRADPKTMLDYASYPERFPNR